MRGFINFRRSGTGPTPRPGQRATRRSAGRVRRSCTRSRHERCPSRLAKVNPARSDRHALSRRSCYRGHSQHCTGCYRHQQYSSVREWSRCTANRAGSIGGRNETPSIDATVREVRRPCSGIGRTRCRTPIPPHHNVTPIEHPRQHQPCTHHGAWPWA